MHPRRCVSGAVMRGTGSPQQSSLGSPAAHRCTSWWHYFFSALCPAHLQTVALWWPSGPEMAELSCPLTLGQGGIKYSFMIGRESGQTENKTNNNKTQFLSPGNRPGDQFRIFLCRAGKWAFISGSPLLTPSSHGKWRCINHWQPP